MVQYIINMFANQQNLLLIVQNNVQAEKTIQKCIFLDSFLCFYIETMLLNNLIISIFEEYSRLPSRIYIILYFLVTKECSRHIQLRSEVNFQFIWLIALSQANAAFILQYLVYLWCRSLIHSSVAFNIHFVWQENLNRE